jgi:hypothetical protein
MAMLLGAAVGGALGLLYSVAKDILEDDSPDQAKIQAVQDAMEARRQELIAEGNEPAMARSMANREFKAALDEASQDVDGTTFGDYVGNAVTGASLGAGVGWASGTARGATALNKAKSFLGGGKNTVQEGASSLNPQMAPGRMPAIGGPGPTAMNAPGPTGMPYVAPRAPAAPSASRSEQMRGEILSDLERRPGELAYRKELATKDDGIQKMIDDIMPKRDTGPIPEFLPGEMVSKTPSASLRPWESMPEVIGANIRKEGATRFVGGIEGTPAGATLAPNVMRAAGKRMASERGAAFQSRADVDAAIRQAQIDGEFEKAQLLARIFGG